MKTLFESELVKIWTDGYSPILFVKVFRSLMSPAESEALSKMYVKSLRNMKSQYAEAYCIFDFSEITLPDIKAILTEHVFATPDGMSDMIKAVSVIMPGNRLLAELRNWFHLEDLTDFGVSRSFFTALHYINNARAQHLNYKMAL